MSARSRILDLFMSNISEVIDKTQIAEVAQIAEWARRIRELRDEHGYDIKSHKDDRKLKPGQYILHNPIPSPVAKERKISKDQYFRILSQDGHKCLSCGRSPGEVHPTDPRRTIKLVVDHIIPISSAEAQNIQPNDDSNLQTLCDFCNEGKANKYIGKIGEARENLKALVRNAPLEVQKEIYLVLKSIFE
ncbi:MAG: 5-methylcytosine-specific restriction endonuclease McrA [Cocleimonas sp.]|jgi:5-methylcytosine-specific restriction endonuclease McrA